MPEALTVVIQIPDDPEVKTRVVSAFSEKGGFHGCPVTLVSVRGEKRNDSFAARDLEQALTDTYGDDWELTMLPGGHGQIETNDGTQFFSFASELDTLIEGKLKQPA